MSHISSLCELLSVYLILCVKVQAALPASSFPISFNSIDLGNFLTKVAGTKAYYDSIFEKREGIWYSGDSNLK